MKENDLKAISERLLKAAEEVRNLKPQVKIAKQELDPQKVLDFMRFFGARRA